MKKILDYLKKYFSSIFKRRDNHTEVDYGLDDSIIEEIKKDDEENNSIKEKDKTEIIRDINVNWELIDKLSQYDIVWVRMADQDIVRYRIEPTHQERPFIILNKDYDRNKMVGHYLSSNVSNTFFSKEGNEPLKLLLKKSKYKLDKDSIILLDNLVEVPYKKIKYLIDSLYYDEIDKLDKYKKLLKGEVLKSSECRVELGDIIELYDKKYIVFNLNEETFDCYRIELVNSLIDFDKTNYSKFLFNKDYYEVDYDYQYSFRKDDDFDIIGRIKEDYVIKIKNGNIIQNNSYKIRKTGIGDIIIYDGKNYIIHQTDNTNYYGYFIKKSNDIYEPSKDFNHFYIGPTQYYVDYSDNMVFKNSEQHPIVGDVSQDFVDVIRKRKISLKHNNKVEKKVKKKKKS